MITLPIRKFDVKAYIQYKFIKQFVLCYLLLIDFET